MAVIEAIRRELKAARLADRPVAQLVITPHALAGSVAAVPIPSDRTRSANVLEVLIHPDDWLELCRELGVRLVGPSEVLGVPVVWRVPRGVL